MIIALGYKSGVGKDTAASVLCSQHGFRRVKFAFRLKQAAKILYDFSADEVDGDLRNTPSEQWGITPREMLQQLGDLCNKLTPNYTSRIIDMKAITHHGIDNVVFTDMRTKAEAFAVRNAGGYCVKVLRDKLPTVGAHTTETELDKFCNWDYELSNFGDMDMLETNIKRMMDVLRFREKHPF
jgi:hypothetical protein